MVQLTTPLIGVSLIFKNGRSSASTNRTSIKKGKLFYLKHFHIMQNHEKCKYWTEAPDFSIFLWPSVKIYLFLVVLLSEFFKGSSQSLLFVWRVMLTVIHHLSLKNASIQCPWTQTRCTTQVAKEMPTF